MRNAVKVADGLLSAAESMLWASRARVMAPLLDEFAGVMAARFNSQRAYVLRNIVNGALLQEAKRKPGDDADKFDGWQDAPARMNTMDRIVKLSVSAGAEGMIRDAGVSISFKPVTDPIITKYLEERGAAKIGADVDATTKKRLRDTLIKGYEEHWTRSRLTREIRDMFTGFARRTPWSFIGSRAEAIAVTELGQAYSEGSLQGAFRAQDESGLELQKAWALAATPCPICAPNGVQGWIALDKPFASGHLRPLAHVVCRCSLLTRVKPS